MKIGLMWAMVLLAVLACAPVHAFEFGIPGYPGYPGCPSDIIDGLFAVWGSVECIEGEVIECSSSISLGSITGHVSRLPLTGMTAVFINGYPGALAAMMPVVDAPFYARCYISAGRLLLVDASYVGFECQLLGYQSGRVHVRLGDGTERELEMWPHEEQMLRSILPGRAAVANLFVLVDPDGRIRRIWRSDKSG